uniref:KIB1-4 beta-propeller domain-containing protein n=1 Tax=Chenopodium quinoa TaxID=63459 RepID=A0A803MFR9_CHEQI
MGLIFLLLINLSCFPTFQFHVLSIVHIWFYTIGGVLVGSPPLLFGKEIADVVDLSGELNERFDDIVNFNGIICALNSQGKLYQLGIDKFALLPLVDTPIVTNDLSFHRCRKRLVESSATGKLYLVCKSMPCLRVFELSNGNCCSRQWVEVKSFGDDDLVLFESKNYCFFAAAAEFPGCQLRNCIIFSRYAFPPKFRDDWNSKVLKVEEEPKIYQLGSTEGFKPISSYPGFPLNLWSPPQWILHGHTPVSMPSHRGPIESDEMLPSSSNLEGGTLQKHTQKSSAPLSGPISRKGTTEIVSISSAQEKTTGNSSNFEAREETMKILSSTEDVDHVIEQASRLEALREECSNTKITHSVSRAYITSITQSDQSDNSTVKFEGLEIRSSLLSTLQKVWSKHGNLTENITICNGDIVSRVLESLATAVLILEENSARSLSDSQADYLSSTLSDLRCMQFKVDWLVPYVESAVELHKSKPLLDSRDKLGHCKAQVAEKISKTLEELAALDKLADELDEEIANVSKVIPFSGNVDLDKLLGGGLS